MIITSQPEILHTSKGYTLTFTVREDDAENLFAVANKIKPGYEYDLTIKRHYGKRSLDANAYAWRLIGQISAEVGLPPIEVYHQFILDSFCYRDVLVRDDNVQKEISDWKEQGYGWLCEVLGPSPQHEGYTWLRKFRGSSSFNSVEMQKFIENIEFDAREFGIEITRNKKDKFVDVFDD